MIQAPPTPQPAGTARSDSMSASSRSATAAAAPAAAAAGKGQENADATLDGEKSLSHSANPELKRLGQERRAHLQTIRLVKQAEVQPLCTQKTAVAHMRLCSMLESASCLPWSACSHAHHHRAP